MLPVSIWTGWLMVIVGVTAESDMGRDNIGFLAQGRLCPGLLPVLAAWGVEHPQLDARAGPGW